jgi:3-methylfumaryl-CoA hydratase
VPDPALLFRFSALTANAHRIHYDFPYATQVEGYPGLLVQGPLLALSLLELPRRFAGERTVRDYTYRARHPLFAPKPILVCGGPEEDGTVRLRAGEAFTGTARLT